MLQFTSGIRPPSSIPTPGKLFEMSASATNSRANTMPPPANTLKRKTLAERAGETGRPAPAPPASKLVNGFVRTSSLAGPSRETSLSSSINSSRPSSSASTRNVSNSSYGSSVGSSTRPPSAQAYRPHSAMAYSRLQKPVTTSHRSTTSLEMHEEEPGTGRITNKRKGRTPSSSNPPDCPLSLHAPKVRRRNTPSKDYTTNWEARELRKVSFREVSLNTRFNRLDLNEEPPQPTPIVEADKRPPSSMAHFAPKADPEVPKTPSHIPKLVPRAAFPAEPQSSSKSPQKTPKGQAVFLTRDSNVTAVWDTDSRLEEVENMCSQFKEKMDGATSESKSLKEMMAVYKIRSMT